MRPVHDGGHHSQLGDLRLTKGTIDCCAHGGVVDNQRIGDDGRRSVAIRSGASSEPCCGGAAVREKEPRVLNIQPTHLRTEIPNSLDDSIHVPVQIEYMKVVTSGSFQEIGGRSCQEHASVHGLPEVDHPSNCKPQIGQPHPNVSLKCLTQHQKQPPDATNSNKTKSQAKDVNRKRAFSRRHAISDWLSFLCMSCLCL